MRTFSKTLFGGYQRDEVDDYIDSVMRELNRLKNNVQEDLEAEKKHSAELQEKLQHSEAECTRLSEQLTALRLDAERLSGLEERASKYEREYGQLQDVLAEARLEAKEISSAAQLNAQEILRKAQADADAVLEEASKQAAERLRQAQSEIDRTQKAAEARSEQLQLSIQRQAEAVKTSRSCLMRVHEELGDILEMMPEGRDAGEKTLTIVSTLANHQTKGYGA